MNSRSIYIDIDDVICDTTVTFPSLLEEHFGKTIPFESITSFDLGKSFDLDKDELDRFMDIAHSPEAVNAYRPRAGAVESIKSFTSLGYDIVIVTGRPPYAKDLTEDWLANHHVPFHDLLFVDKYSRMFPDVPSAAAISLETLAQMNFFFAVEDSGYMAAFLSQQMQVPVALLDRPWNRSSKFPDCSSAYLVRRCMDWDEVMDMFHSRANSQRSIRNNRISHMS